MDSRHRDKDGEISKKHGNTLISILRETYGLDFARRESDTAKLGDVLHRLNEPSLASPVRNMGS
jgi:hypothetical protein